MDVREDPARMAMLEDRLTVPMMTVSEFYILYDSPAYVGFHALDGMLILSWNSQF